MTVQRVKGQNPIRKKVTKSGKIGFNGFKVIEQMDEVEFCFPLYGDVVPCHRLGNKVM